MFQKTKWCLPLVLFMMCLAGCSASKKFTQYSYGIVNASAVIYDVGMKETARLRVKDMISNDTYEEIVKVGLVYRDAGKAATTALYNYHSILSMTSASQDEILSAREVAFVALKTLNKSYKAFIPLLQKIGVASKIKEIDEIERLKLTEEGK